MGVTINANGLSIVHQGSGGMASASPPDVCMTKVGKPTVPIPYSNIAESGDLADGSSTVSADGGNSIAIDGSIFSSSTGDEGGDKKGISSGTITKEAEFITKSPTVSIEGKGVCRLSDKMTMNASNTICSGVNNPSVSVSPDDIGTFSIDIEVQGHQGNALSGAEVEVIDQDGAMHTATLDDNGQASLSGLAPGQFSIEVGEDSRPYALYQTPKENRLAEQDIDIPAMFAALKKGALGFWEPRNAKRSVWGMYGGAVHTCPEVRQIFAYGLQHYAATVIEQRELASLAEALQRLLDEEHNVPDAWEHLTYGLVGLIDELGPAYRLAYQLAQGYDKAQALGMLRYLGEGNPVEFVQELDADALTSGAFEMFEALCTLQIDALEQATEYAEICGYLSLPDHFANHIDALKLLREEASDHISQFVEAKVSAIQGVVG